MFCSITFNFPTLDEKIIKVWASRMWDTHSIYKRKDFISDMVLIDEEVSNPTLIFSYTTIT